MAFDPISAGIEFAGKVVDRIWPDATETQKAEVSRIIAEMTHQENLFGSEVDDRKSARERESAVATSEAAPTLNKIITPVLAIGVLVATIGLFAGVIFGSGEIDPSRKDIAMFVLGQLAGICTMVVAYYFGSSSGSTAKNTVIKDLLNKHE